ncbi:MAG: glycosyltransferase [Sneathiella sp.]|nr:glycosyltransferase [Sneathiella sp.]
MSGGAPKTVLWWGRFDPDYSRNRILRQAFTALGWRIEDFRPRISALGTFEAALKNIKAPDLVWLPAFRQRDLAAAARWAKARNIPLVFDPMISAYDKQVFERAKFPETSGKAQKLLRWETTLFHLASIVIADTAGHAAFFEETFALSPEKIRVIALGAEENLFQAAPMEIRPEEEPLEALFFGSFIGLQAPEIIVEAARLCEAPVCWTLLGDGPLKTRCRQMAIGQPNVSFEDYLPYPALPERIRKADILLGIFGTSDKAARVIPNKVYQSLACGRVVITRLSSAYPPAETMGLLQLPAGDAKALADKVTELCGRRGELPALGAAARTYYETNFSTETVQSQLAGVLSEVSGG